MVTLAITGGIACGKSLVGSWLVEAGFAVCEADDVARGLMVPGQTVYRAVVEAFGPEILAADGAIDRRRLGARVFSDAGARETLDGLVHPAVRAAIDRWAAGRRLHSENAAVIVPLLYEAGMSAGWDAVVCVAAPRALQVRRLTDRGLDVGEALRRIDAQWPQWRKMALADFVVFNGGTRECLRAQVERVLRRILETQR